MFLTPSQVQLISSTTSKDIVEKEAYTCQRCMTRLQETTVRGCYKRNSSWKKGEIIVCHEKDEAFQKQTQRGWGISILGEVDSFATLDTGLPNPALKLVLFGAGCWTRSSPEVLSNLNLLVHPWNLSLYSFLIIPIFSLERWHLWIPATSFDNTKQELESITMN